MTLGNQIDKIIQERDYYKRIAQAYRALKGKTLEDCPEPCRRGFERRLAIIEEWEKR